MTAAWIFVAMAATSAATGAASNVEPTAHAVAVRAASGRMDASSTSPAPEGACGADDEQPSASGTPERTELVVPALLAGGFAAQAVVMGQGAVLTGAYATYGLVNGLAFPVVTAALVLAAPAVGALVAVVAGVLAYDAELSLWVPVAVALLAGTAAFVASTGVALAAGPIVEAYRLNDEAAVVAAVAVLAAGTLLPAVAVGGITAAGTAVARGFAE